MGTSEARPVGAVVPLEGYYTTVQAERALRVPTLLLRFAICATGITRYQASRSQKMIDVQGLKTLDEWFARHDPEGRFRVVYGGPRGHRPKPGRGVKAGKPSAAPQAS